MRKRGALIVGATAALGLAGCGSSGGSAGTVVRTVTVSASSTPTSKTVPQPGDTSSPTDPPTSENDVPNIPTVPLGSEYQNGSNGITLQSAKCGSTAIPGAGHDADYNTTTYRAKAGKKFCIIRGIFRNIGTSPLDAVPSLGDIADSKNNTYAQEDDDNSASSSLASKGQTAPGYGVTINPSSSIGFVVIYQVPTAAVAETLIFTGQFDETPLALFKLR